MVFLRYLNDWEVYVNNQLDLSAGDKSKMMLSRETLEGLRITGELILHVTFLVKSFVEMTRYLLSDSQCTFVLSDRISQDPL